MGARMARSPAKGRPLATRIPSPRLTRPAGHRYPGAALPGFGILLAFGTCVCCSCAWRVELSKIPTQQNRFFDIFTLVRYLKACATAGGSNPFYARYRRRLSITLAYSVGLSSVLRSAGRLVTGSERSRNARLAS